MLLALRPRGATNVSPPSVTGNVRWASGHRRRGSFDVAAAALAAERNVNKRHQLIGRVRSRRHRHPVIIPVHLQSSMSGHFSASTTTSSSCVVTVESTCCVSPKRGTTPTAPSSVVCAAPARTSSTDCVHKPMTTTCLSTMVASSSCPPPTSVCRRLPSLNRPPFNSSVLKLLLEVRPSSSSFFIDPAPRRCSEVLRRAG